MFVMTEENGMVNLGNWEGVKIDKTVGIYTLLAFNDYVIDQQSRDISLVSFDKQEDAVAALSSLCAHIRADKKIWDAKAYKDSIGKPQKRKRQKHKNPFM